MSDGTILVALIVLVFVLGAVAETVFSGSPKTMLTLGAAVMLLVGLAALTNHLTRPPTHG